MTFICYWFLSQYCYSGFVCKFAGYETKSTVTAEWKELELVDTFLSSLCQPRYGVIHSPENVGKVVFKSTFERTIVPKSGGNIVRKTTDIHFTFTLAEVGLTHLTFLAPNICQQRNQHFFGSSLISTPPQDFASMELFCKEQTTYNYYKSDINCLEASS